MVWTPLPHPKRYKEVVREQDARTHLGLHLHMERQCKTQQSSSPRRPPTITGAIFDRTGSYENAIFVFIGTYSASLVLFLIALRLPRPLAHRGT